MSIAVIALRKEPAYRREAFERGLGRLGYHTAFRGVVDKPHGPDDLLVLWNRKAGADDKLATEWERRGGTVLVVENAYLQKVDKSAYAISTHGHTGSGWFPVGDEDRFMPLGFPIKDDVTRPGAGILVLGQRSIGSPTMASPPQWAEKHAEQWRAQGARVRPHPGNFKPRVPLRDDLATAGSVHVWSSSGGVLALTEGLLVQHYAPHWICDHNRAREVRRRLNNMAHGQWSVAEIESGEPFARMKAENWGPRW